MMAEVMMMNAVRIYDYDYNRDSDYEFMIHDYYHHYKLLLYM